MRLRVLIISLFSLTALLCQSQYVYRVNDTIGTEVFHTTADFFYIYETTLADCRLFNFSNGDLRFNRVYDFNLELESLDLSCSFLLNGDIPHTFYVFVIDTNDHAPVFSSGEFSFIVDEQVADLVPDVSVTLPEAADPDEPPYDVQSYTLFGDRYDLEYFNFDPTTRVLVPSGMPPIDRENRSSFHFNLTASDGGSPPRISSVISINILINDANDNTPYFLPYNSSFNFAEGKQSGYILGVFTAEDEDTGPNGDIIYRLSSQKAYKDGLELPAEDSSIFQINASSGQVELLEDLDYEKFDTIALTVEAADLGQPPLSNSAVINVYVIDQLDSLPELTFTKTYPGNIFPVMENSDPKMNFFFVLFAFPLSENATANLTLLTYPDNSTDTLPFSISRPAVHWIFKLNTTLDRENISQYEFTVLFEANFPLAPSLSSRTRLTVPVLDANDESPHFHDPPSGCLSFEENSTGLITTLEVSDGDTGSNAQLTFSISSFPPGYGPHFQIDIPSGELRVIKELDFEEVTKIDLNVTARDGGTPSLSNSIELSLCITNINDNPIQFAQPNYSLSVPINSLQFTRLLTVQASDRDNASSPIFYYLSEDSRTFSLLPATGDLILASCLRTGSVTQTLQVNASHCLIGLDYPTQCEVSSTNISVSVTEEVSLLPQSIYTVCLSKDNRTDSIPLFSLGTSYLNGYNFNSSFGSPLTVQNNHLYLNSSMSHLQETCSEYPSCYVTINNSCDGNHTEHINLNFLFVEEIVSSIQFSQSSYSIFRPEGNYSNATLLDLSLLLCPDWDRAISFSLSGDPFPPSLTLSQSGLLLLTGSLDIDFVNATTNYNFTIEAKVVNSTVSATTTVLFQINATNDHSPELCMPITQLLLNSSYSPGESVARFRAKDADLGSETQFSYVLSIDLDWLLTDEFTGVIYISENIDTDIVYFRRENTFNSTITVSDGGSPPRNYSYSFAVIIGESFRLISPPSYWYIPVGTICILALLLVVLAVAVLILVFRCRNKFCFSAKLRIDSTKSSRVWEVLENNNASYVCRSVTRNGEDNIVDSISKSTKSSGLGVSIDSFPSLMVPMTDAEIKRIIDSNRDLVQQLGSAPQLQDYNEDSPAPPTLAGEDNDLHLVFGDELSQVSISNGDKCSQDGSPIDIIFSNPDTRFLCPSHSPQSSASSSYLSSVSHQRPRIAYNVPHPRDAAKNREPRLAPLPSASIPSFSQKARSLSLALSQQPDNLDSIEAAN